MTKPNKQIFINENGRKIAFYFVRPNSSMGDIPEDSVLVLNVGVTGHFGYYIPVRLNEKGKRYIEWYWFNGIARNNLPQDFIKYIGKVVKLLTFL